MTIFTRLRRKVTIHQPLNLKRSPETVYIPYVPTGKPIPKKGGIDPLFYPPFENQYNVGQCTMATSCEVRMIDQAMKAQPVIKHSEIFGYNRGVIRMGNPMEDSGLDGLTMMKVNCEDGLPPEKDWPSDQHKFTDTPPQYIIDRAKLYCAKRAEKMNGINDVLDCLGNRKEPVFCAAILYQSFMTEKAAKSGIIPNPGWRWVDPQIGGHEMTVLSYDKTRKYPYYNGIGYLDLQNHWVRSANGSKWGDDGKAHMRIDYPGYMEFWRLIL